MKAHFNRMLIMGLVDGFGTLDIMKELGSKVRCMDTVRESLMIDKLKKKEFGKMTFLKVENVKFICLNFYLCK